MEKFMNIGAKAFKRGFILACLFATFGCSKSLDSVDGPEVGMVFGLVCNDLAVLTAAVEVPAIQNTLVKDGKCLNLRTRAKVSFLRTVMMPGDGKYSQFEYTAEGKALKLWIRTSNVR